MIGFDFSSPWLTKHRGFAYAVPVLFVGIAAIAIDYMARVFMAEPIGLLMLSAVPPATALSSLVACAPIQLSASRSLAAL